MFLYEHNCIGSFQICIIVSLRKYRSTHKIILLRCITLAGVFIDGIILKNFVITILQCFQNFDSWSFLQIKILPILTFFSRKALYCAGCLSAASFNHVILVHFLWVIDRKLNSYIAMEAYHLTISNNIKLASKILKPYQQQFCNFLHMISNRTIEFFSFSS